MGILSFSTTLPGQSGNFIGGNVPRRISLTTTDNLATITTAGYLNNLVKASGNNIYPTDILDIWFNYVSNSSPGTYSAFTPSIANGVITLSEFVTPGDILLPVVNGNLAVFNGTSGQIKDANLAPGTAAAKVASDNTKPNVASVSAATIAGNFLKAADTAGTVADGGAAIHAGVTATYAGGGTSNAFVTTNMTAASIVTASILTSTNSVSITKVLPGTNTLTVTFSADPGAGTTVNWISITPAI